MRAFICEYLRMTDYLIEYGNIVTENNNAHGVDLNHSGSIRNLCI